MRAARAVRGRHIPEPGEGLGRLRRALVFANCITASLLASKRTSEVPPAVLLAAAECLLGSAATFWTVDHAAGVLRPLAVWIAPAAALDEFAAVTRKTVYRSGEGPPGRTWSTGAPDWLEALDLDERLRLALEGLAKPTWALWFPVRNRGDIRGVVEIISDDPRPPDEHLLQEASTVGLRVGGCAAKLEAEEALRESLERLHIVINASPEDVVQLKDADGRWLEASATAIDLFQIDSIDWRGKRDAELATHTLLNREALLACAASDALTWARGDTTRQEEVVRCADGSSRTFDVVKVPLYHDDGRPKLMVILARDITERRRAQQERDRLLAHESAARCAAVAAERRRAFLAEASRALSTSLEYESTLSDLARLAVPYLADWCVVFTVDRDGWIHVNALACRIHGASRLARELEGFALDPRGSGLVPDAIRAGTATLVHPSRDEDLVAAMGVPHGAWELLHPLGATQLIVAPLVARGRALGAVALVRAEAEPAYGSHDLELAEEFARHGAQAADNARLYRERESAMRTREELLSIASHELRTPLTALHLLTETLKRRLATEASVEPAQMPRLRQHVDKAHMQVERLARLVDCLLDVSRVARGRLGLQLEDVDLGVVTQEVAGRFEPMATQAGCAIELHVPRRCLGWWDRLRVEQVATNLISNAIKYAPRAPIEISVECDPAVARLIVRDHGPGIAQTDIARIFGRFERAVPVRHGEGLGLGLYITRQIVEAHAGSIRVESDPGRGSTFTVEMPYGKPPAPPVG